MGPLNLLLVIIRLSKSGLLVAIVSARRVGELHVLVMDPPYIIVRTM